MVREFRSKDTWIIFRIMAEFVEGFETLGPVWPAVSIFGGAASKGLKTEANEGAGAGRNVRAASPQ